MSVASSRPPTPGAPNLRALKILVVVMGIAIVASVIVIVVAISNRLADKEAADSPSARSMAETPAAVAIGDLSIAIPEGCVIAEASAEGPRLILRFDGLAARGCQQVVLIDLESGTVLGRVTATPGG